MRRETAPSCGLGGRDCRRRSFRKRSGGATATALAKRITAGVLAERWAGADFRARLGLYMAC